MTFSALDSVFPGAECPYEQNAVGGEGTAVVRPLSAYGISFTAMKSAQFQDSSLFICISLFNLCKTVCL